MKKDKRTDLVTKSILLFGGEAEIRTLEALLTPTRFPVVRPRPTRRLLQLFICVADLQRCVLYHNGARMSRAIFKKYLFSGDFLY